jgi:hypothetical protein
LTVVVQKEERYLDGRNSEKNERSIFVAPHHPAEFYDRSLVRNCALAPRPELNGRGSQNGSDWQYQRVAMVIFPAPLLPATETVTGTWLPGVTPLGIITFTW